LYLFISYSGGFGGAERVLVDVAGALAGEVCVACPPGPLADAAGRRGLRVMTLRSRPLALRSGGGRLRELVTRVSAARALVGHRFELARLAADLDPSVIALWGMRPAIAWRLWGLSQFWRFWRPPGAGGACVVFAHHDMLPDARGVARLVRAAAARADAIIVNSRAVADDLDPTASLGSRLSIVYPGVDPAPGSDRAGLAPSGWPDGPPVVVVIGALVGWKRVDLALEAVALARRTVPSLQLRVVGAPLMPAWAGSAGSAGSAGFGDGTLERLRARASAPDLVGAVQFTGAVADVQDELARATCLVHCAEREPFGLVVAEALAAGRPVVVPTSGGPAEIADADCGVLYPPGDVAAAAAGVVSLVREPERARALGETGRLRMIERFGRERMRTEFAAALTPGGVRRDADAARLAGWRPGRWPGSVGDGVNRAAGAPRSAALALVTVSFNSEAVLGTLLDSTARHLPGVRVIVVDCGSSDDSVRIAREHPVAVSVPTGTNLGFGAGSNLGLTHVVEAATVFVNPDVELIDDSLLSLSAELAAEGHDRLLAPLVLSPEGTRQDTVHPAPGSAAELARLVLSPGLVPGPLGRMIAPWRSRQPRPVGWAVGCALAGRTATLGALGPFSDSIFMYGEDLELGLRAGRSGVPTWFWPQARVIHRAAHSTAAAYGGEPFDVLARARHHAVALTFGEPAARQDDRRQAALFASRAALKRALRRDRRRELAQLSAVRGR
jgi:glycosyltransferase involved in cell wall biosynthesis/GT2 family glycosyltransferase